MIKTFESFIDEINPKEKNKLVDSVSEALWQIIKSGNLDCDYNGLEGENPFILIKIDVKDQEFHFSVNGEDDILETIYLNIFLTAKPMIINFYGTKFDVVTFDDLDDPQAMVDFINEK